MNYERKLKSLKFFEATAKSCGDLGITKQKAAYKIKNLENSLAKHNKKFFDKIFNSEIHKSKTHYLEQEITRINYLLDVLNANPNSNEEDVDIRFIVNRAIKNCEKHLPKAKVASINAYVRERMFNMISVDDVTYGISSKDLYFEDHEVKQTSSENSAEKTVTLENNQSLSI